MRKTRYLLYFSGILLAVSLLLGMGSCGTTRAHIGIDHDIAYNWDQGRYDSAPRHGHHKPPKPPKPPKHKKAKKPKPPKHDKHKHDKHKHHKHKHDKHDRHHR
ncbi:MAG: hypothetical protein HDR80_10650 [Bacteroides sp.]|nr:hypothetical protein [Bacteroides sp.]